MFVWDTPHLYIHVSESVQLNNFFIGPKINILLEEFKLTHKYTIRIYRETVETFPNWTAVVDLLHNRVLATRSFWRNIFNTKYIKSMNNKLKSIILINF